MAESSAISGQCDLRRRHRRGRRRGRWGRPVPGRRRASSTDTSGSPLPQKSVPDSRESSTSCTAGSSQTGPTPPGSMPRAASRSGAAGTQRRPGDAEDAGEVAVAQPCGAGDRCEHQPVVRKAEGERLRGGLDVETGQVQVGLGTDRADGGAAGRRRRHGRERRQPSGRVPGSRVPFCRAGSAPDRHERARRAERTRWHRLADRRPVVVDGLVGEACRRTRGGRPPRGRCLRARPGNRSSQHAQM